MRGILARMEAASFFVLQKRKRYSGQPETAPKITYIYDKTRKLWTQFDPKTLK
jgi:hypothetical protein